MYSPNDLSIITTSIRGTKTKPYYILPVKNYADYPFTRAFKYFSKFGDPDSQGIFITYDQSNVWLAEASVIDGKEVTFQDAAACFKQLGNTSLSFSFYTIFVYNLSQRVGTKFSVIKRKMCAVKYPNGTIANNGALRKVENCFCGTCGLYLKMKIKPKTCFERLQCLFTAFAKFGKNRSDGKYINLSQVDKWMKQAKVFDEKRITTADTAIYFKKMRKMKIDFTEFITFLDDIAKAKRMDGIALKEKLWRCDAPEFNGIGAVDGPNIFKKIKSRLFKSEPVRPEKSAKKTNPCSIV